MSTTAPTGRATGAVPSGPIDTSHRPGARSTPARLVPDVLTGTSTPPSPRGAGATAPGVPRSVAAQLTVAARVPSARTWTSAVEPDDGVAKGTTAPEGRWMAPGSVRP